MGDFKTFLDSHLKTSEYNIVPLAGDASTRRYYRVIAGKNSWVLMEWEPFEKVDDFPFLSVQQYFDKNQVRVPKVHHYDSQQGLFLLEDLGDLTLERRFWEFQNQDVILPFYQKTLDELIKIHSLNFEEKQAKSCSAYKIEFNVDKLLWEMNYAKKFLLKGFLNLELSPDLEQKLEQEFQSICEELYQSPQVICHRDFHSRNVMLHYNDLVVIDFQDARMGPPVYDLVSLFCDSYVELSDKSQEELMKYYVSNFPHFDKLQLTPSQWNRFYDIQVVQRCFKACGSFASFKVNRDDNRYLHYIPRTLERVCEYLGKTESAPELLKVLQDSKVKWDVKK